MRNDTGQVAADKQYSAAHTEHYITKDLHEAFKLYRGVIVAHPKTKAAEFARTQIQNIVNFVIPKKALFDSQMNLALAHFENGK